MRKFLPRLGTPTTRAYTADPLPVRQSRIDLGHPSRPNPAAAKWWSNAKACLIPFFVIRTKLVASTAESLCRSGPSIHAHALRRSEAVQSSIESPAMPSSESLQLDATSREVFRSRNVKVSTTTGTDENSNTRVPMICRQVSTARACNGSPRMARAIQAPLSMKAASRALIRSGRKSCRALRRFLRRAPSHRATGPSAPPVRGRNHTRRTASRTRSATLRPERLAACCRRSNSSSGK